MSANLSEGMNEEARWRMVRLSLLIASGGVVALEWLRVNRILLAGEAALTSAGEAVPRRVEGFAHGCLSLTVGFLGFSAWLEISSPMVHGADGLEGAIAVTVVVAGLLSLVWVQWFTLVLCALSQARVALALLKIPKVARPDPRSSAPWTVAALAAPGLFFALVGTPSAETVNLLGRLTLEVLEAQQRAASQEAAGSRAAPSSGRTSTLTALSSATAEPVTATSCSKSWLPWADDPYAQREFEAIGVSAELDPYHQARRPVLVAILDTGVDGSHPDLTGVAKVGFNQDADGHGTAVAGVVAAVANNGAGVASLNVGGRLVRVASYPVLADDQAGEAELADAIDDAVAGGAKVINLSLGASGPPPDAVAAAVARAFRNDVVVVTAAGNDGGDSSDRWPANVPGVVVVGSSEGGFRADYSDVPAPGAWGVYAPGAMCTTRTGGGYIRVKGTSISAGVASGAIAAIRAVCPGVTASSVINAISDVGAKQLDVSGAMRRLGCGVSAPRRVGPRDTG